MKDIPNAKLKTYLLMTFLVIAIFGGTLDILLSASEWDEYLDNLNYASADSTNSGFNFFTDSIDISIGVAGSWEDVDVSAHVPAGSTGVILEMVSTTGLKGYDVRKAGSTDDFYEALVTYTDMHKFAYVGLNSTYFFQMKILDTTVDCYLIGYMDDAVTMLTDVMDFSVGTALSWVDADLSGYLPATATGVIMRVYNTGATLQSGVRHPSSTDNFHLDQRATAFQLCGANSSQMIQIYAETLAVDHYLVGYTESPIQFNINWDDVSLGGVGALTNIDVTAHTTANATGVIIYIQDSVGAWHTGQIREDGSTDNRITDAVIMTDGQTWGSCGLGSGEIFEGYISNTAVDMYVVGYCAERVGANIIYPDHIESSSGVTNATHSMMDNETWAEFDGNGWAIYDFASEIANTTAIRWEISTGGVVIFRIEVSQDLVSWDTVVQMEQTNVGVPPPPSETNSSTRYDSEVHGRFRYLRLQQVKPVIVANDFWVDYVCILVTPPSIDYSGHGYFYPIELEYFRWDIYGDYGADVSYASRPHNALGENMTNPLGTNRSTYTYLVNEDDHPDNYIVLKMDDFYNITVCEALVNYGTSWYLWVSQYADRDFVLVDSWNDPPVGWGWYGHTINATFIRYIKLNATGISTNQIDINAIRLTGVLSGGSGPSGGGVDEFSFYLLPNYIEDLLGLPTGAGSFLASLVILSAFLLPIAVYDRKGIIALIVGVAVFGFLVLLGWLPAWLMLIMILLVAGIFAFNFSSWFGGRSK